MVYIFQNTASYPMETGGLFNLGVKQMEHEADHSPPSSAEVMHRAMPPLSQYNFMALCLGNES
jgi:hypothetical protein